MRFDFAKKTLHELYYNDTGADRYSVEIVEAFFDKMAVIAGAADERDLRALKSLHYEKLKGERGNRGERSIRLNVKHRLTFTIASDNQGKYLHILDIEDYH